MLKVLRFAVLLFGVAVLVAANVQAQVKSPPFAAQTYTIYFGFQAVNVTAEADEVLVLASNHALEGASGIEIVGHADTAESEPSKLSLLRATTVAEALRRHGIPKSVVLVTKGVGTEDLSVATGSGSREPLNRTVTIVIH